MKVGIISDTHDLLRPEVTDVLQDCEYILHCGDISCQLILDQLKQIAPVKVVRGNNDREWANHLPLFLDFELGGLRVFMTHKKKELPKDLSAYDLVIYGHSHQYFSAWLEPVGQRRTLLLNPGSCGPRRLIQPITMAVLKTEPDGWNIERIDILRFPKEPILKTDNHDIYKQIEIVVREAQRGLSIESIVKKHSLDPVLAEQIARLYVTHPGVSVDGIMTKLGILGKL